MFSEVTDASPDRVIMEGVAIDLADVTRP